MEEILKKSSFHFIGYRNKGSTTSIDTCGTGFFISEQGHFLTAYHNIANRYGDLKYLYAGTMHSNNMDFSTVKFISSWVEQDLLLGQVSRVNTPKLPIKLTDEVFSLNHSCNVFGIHDVVLSQPKEQVQVVSRSKNFFKSSILNNNADFEHIENPVIKPDVYLIQGMAVKGNSGGPVIDNDMNLIGIITGTSNEMNITAIIKNSVIIKFLDKINT